MSTTKVACGVCSGKGGFRKIKEHMLDTNWIDCVYCDGYGFVEEKESPHEADFQKFDEYRDKIEEELEVMADVHVVSTDTLGKDLYVKINPHERKYWVELVKTMLKYAHYSSRVTITPKQVFYFTDEHENKMYWELFITTTSIHDLDGVVDLLKMYNDKNY
jgi:predicted metal-binding protein